MSWRELLLQAERNLTSLGCNGSASEGATVITQVSGLIEAADRAHTWLFQSDSAVARELGDDLLAALARCEGGKP